MSEVVSLRGETEIRIVDLLACFEVNHLVMSEIQQITKLEALRSAVAVQCRAVWPL